MRMVCLFQHIQERSAACQYEAQDYVACFLAVKSIYFQEFERREDGPGEGTTVIIRLL